VGLARAERSALDRRSRDLERLALALAAHDPERALARGWALVEDSSGGLVTSADAARHARTVGLRFHDGSVRAEVQDSQER
jgi:exodeoxyribonuclease VII large subunit